MCPLDLIQFLFQFGIVPNLGRSPSRLVDHHKYRHHSLWVESS